ncbi:ATP-binding protein [Candidatus Peregrinibacteria bacterium]|nr:ATP-binding protein [Candidatus Peregrinibacteria bacterium]
MFNRDIIQELRRWAERSNRKSLVLRGARQVGKTTAVEMFSKEFDQYIYLNLEKSEEREIFNREYPFKDLLTTLFLYAEKKRTGGKTLIFIDEIQNSPKAIALLRYFHEEAKDLYVIAAGSLLESILDRKISFPVGRVEFMAVRPFSFCEFLNANNGQLAEALKQASVPGFLHNQFVAWFKKYTTIGGMPEVVKEYVETNEDITALDTVYNSLIRSYIDDVEKYAGSSSQVPYIRHVIANAFREGGKKITFEKFGDSSYRSREMKEDFRVLEKAMLIHLVHPCTSVELPVAPVIKKKPRLHILDTGLINHSLQIMGTLVFEKNINDAHRGIIAEHIVGQELLASKFSIMNQLNFWTREKAESSAEVDYILPYKGNIIPIEVKAGAIGKLRSLLRFMDEAPHSIAVRVYQGEYLVQQAKTIAGKEFTLLNLPLYMIHRIERELDKIM